MDTVDDVLAHFGVKGMRWGVRKRSPASPVAVQVSARPGKKVKTKGGTGHKPTEEAVKAAVARQKAKKSSLDSLSNEELQVAVKRMQLEQQFSNLQAQRKPAIQKFVKSFLGVGKTMNEVAAFDKSPAGQKIKGELSKAKKGS